MAHEIIVINDHQGVFLKFNPGFTEKGDGYLRNMFNF
jgi:hypothetical protein